MPAHSKSQQQLFGMVHAAQKGELDNPSPEVSKLAHSVSPSAADDFASTSHAGLPDHVQNGVDEMLETIAKYRDYGNHIRRGTSMREVANRLAHIAEIAEQAVVNEADDWFDSHTLKRNMKEIKAYSGEFQKLANEADMMEQRMAALYDDMGRVLERYFHIPTQEQVAQAGAIAEAMINEGPTSPTEDDTTELDAADDKAHSDDHAMPIPNIEPPRPVKEPMNYADDNKVDPLTVRAIKTVHEYLKAKDPKLAERFRKLPAKKMKECVWKMIK